jgi:hypothetical protein
MSIPFSNSLLQICLFSFMLSDIYFCFYIKRCIFSSDKAAFDFSNTCADGTQDEKNQQKNGTEMFSAPVGCSDFIYVSRWCPV